MRVLLLNQCFYPDVMATAQQLTSLAVGLKERGHEVTVITGDRGYDDPSVRFPRLEDWNGIKILRVSSLGLGKNSKWRRALNFASFLIACSFRLLLLPRFDSVVALTSPPLISLLGACFVQLKGGRFFFWVMDLNPDEAIAAGWLKRNSVLAKLLNWLLVYSLRHSERVVVLDRFMKERILAKGIPSHRVAILSPWALTDTARFDGPGREAFRKRHNLSESFVVMYSGNHSPCHPLDTLLEAAKRLCSRTDVSFLFVGGGSEQVKVADFAAQNELTNVRCLPYQSLSDLPGSLSAADLHVVVMGDPFVGIIHPCKVYNIITVGTPFLYIGAKESCVGDITAQLESKYRVYQARLGDIDSVEKHILTAHAAGRVMNHFSSEIADRFSEETLLPRMVGILESEATLSEQQVLSAGY